VEEAAAAAAGLVVACSCIGAGYASASDGNEFLQADLVDYLHIVLVPIVLGRGVRLWDGLGGLHERYTLETVTVPSGATHLFFTR
jgi:hypothetical protein